MNLLPQKLLDVQRNHEPGGPSGVTTPSGQSVTPLPPGAYPVTPLSPGTCPAHHWPPGHPGHCRLEMQNYFIFVRYVVVGAGYQPARQVPMTNET